MPTVPRKRGVFVSWALHQVALHPEIVRGIILVELARRALVMDHAKLMPGQPSGTPWCRRAR